MRWCTMSRTTSVGFGSAAALLGMLRASGGRVEHPHSPGHHTQDRRASVVRDEILARRAGRFIYGTWGAVHASVRRDCSPEALRKRASLLQTKLGVLRDRPTQQAKQLD
jgi:hypothetical protein